MLEPKSAHSPNKYDSGEYTQEERNPQVNSHALRNFADGDVYFKPFEAEPRWKDSDENKRVCGVEQYLEYGIESYQTCSVLAITPGQFVPNYDHRDATGRADQDYACHKFRLVAKEDYGQEEHK